MIVHLKNGQIILYIHFKKLIDKSDCDYLYLFKRKLYLNTYFVIVHSFTYFKTFISLTQNVIFNYKPN